jgi:subtilisin family serine protease
MPAAAFAQRDAEPVRVRETPEHLRVPGRIFLQMTREARESGEGEQFVRTMTEMFGGRVLRRYNTLLPGMVLLEVPAGHERMIAEIARFSREIESVGWDTWGVPNSVPNDPRAVNGEMWWRANVCIDPVWNAGINSAPDVTVALIDSGVNYLAPDLAPNMWVNPLEGNGVPNVDDDGNGFFDDVHGIAFFWDDPYNPPPCASPFASPSCSAGDLCYDWQVPPWLNEPILGYPCEYVSTFNSQAGYSEDPWDRDVRPPDGTCPCPQKNGTWTGGHGTLSAAVMAARGDNNLQATGVVWDANLMAIRVSDTAWNTYFVGDFIAGLEYAVYEGASVVCTTITYAYSDALESAVWAATQQDVVIVASAGNVGVDVDTPFGQVAQPKRYPAAFHDIPGVVSVGASNLVDDRWITPSGGSSWGAQSVDVFAPGENLPALDRMFGGTSGAAPLVAGIVTLYRQRYPGASAEKIENDIVGTARCVPALIGKCRGNGIINAREFLNIPGTCPPPLTNCP